MESLLPYIQFIDGGFWIQNDPFSNGGLYNASCFKSEIARRAQVDQAVAVLTSLKRTDMLIIGTPLLFILTITTNMKQGIHECPL